MALHIKSTQWTINRFTEPRTSTFIVELVATRQNSDSLSSLQLLQTNHAFAGRLSDSSSRKLFKLGFRQIFAFVQCWETFVKREIRFNRALGVQDTIIRIEEIQEIELVSVGGAFAVGLGGFFDEFIWKLKWGAFMQNGTIQQNLGHSSSNFQFVAGFLAFGGVHQNEI